MGRKPIIQLNPHAWRRRLYLLILSLVIGPRYETYNADTLQGALLFVDTTDTDSEDKGGLVW